ncbi:hypothetical protein ADUPG1_013311 [Aduncisulcus paluster]|uniref:Uncharacterized protein n=1 Tax=Aduncisulcus paluster TaxID=2918883 RepID=A0ABQ5K2G4_9EUKA|nr:hypothetical protein ADUPG1_013311 [Aduncisulcus paluster]
MERIQEELSSLLIEFDDEKEKFEEAKENSNLTIIALDGILDRIKKRNAAWEAQNLVDIRIPKPPEIEGGFQLVPHSELHKTKSKVAKSVLDEHKKQTRIRQQTTFDDAELAAKLKEMKDVAEKRDKKDEPIEKPGNSSSKWRSKTSQKSLMVHDIESDTKIIKLGRRPKPKDSSSPSRRFSRMDIKRSAIPTTSSQSPNKTPLDVDKAVALLRQKFKDNAKK